MYSGPLPAVLNAGALRLGVPWDDHADLIDSLSADWRVFFEQGKVSCYLLCEYHRARLKIFES